MARARGDSAVYELEEKYPEPITLRKTGHGKSQWTFDLLHVLAVLNDARRDDEYTDPYSQKLIAKRHRYSVAWIAHETGICRQNLYAMLARLQENGLVEYVETVRRASIWDIAPKGVDILKVGIRKRLCRRNRFEDRYNAFLDEINGDDDYLGIMRVTARLNKQLKEIGWKPHLRYEVFRAVPLKFIRKILSRSKRMKSAFAYSFQCLLGRRIVDRNYCKNGKPMRYTVREKELRRLTGYLFSRRSIARDHTFLCRELENIADRIFLEHKKPGSALAWAFENWK